MGNFTTKTAYSNVSKQEPPPSYDSVFNNVILPPSTKTSANSLAIQTTQVKLWRPEDPITYRRDGNLVSVPFDFGPIPPDHMEAFLQGVAETQVLHQIEAGKIKVTTLTQALLDNIARYALIKAVNPSDTTALSSKVTGRYHKPNVMRYVLLSKDLDRIQRVCRGEIATLLDDCILNQVWLRDYQVVDLVKAWSKGWSMAELLAITQLRDWRYLSEFLGFITLLGRTNPNQSKILDTLILNLIVNDIKLIKTLDYQLVQKIQPDWAPNSALRIMLQVALQTWIIKTSSVDDAITTSHGSLRNLLAIVARYQIRLDDATVRCCFSNEWLVWLVSQGYLSTSQITWLEQCLATETDPGIKRRLAQAVALHQTRVLSTGQTAVTK